MSHISGSGHKNKTFKPEMFSARNAVDLRSEGMVPVLGEKELEEMIMKLKTELDEEWKHSMKVIKSYLTPFLNNDNHALINNWHDGFKLDILHYCIISNRPDVINFMLESGFFSPKHIPLSNPYAHLAAYIGNKECLHSILLHRPDDFFKTSESHHRVHLPGHIMKRLKLTDNVRCGMTKHMIKTLNRIQMSTEDAESNIISFPSEGEGVSAQLEKEFEIIKNNQKTKSNRGKVQSLPKPNYPVLSNKQKYIARLTSSESATSQKQWRTPQKSEISTLGSEKTPEHMKSGIERPEPMKAKLKRHCRRHLITVHLDVFRDSPQGVIGGAGKPVKVVHKNKNVTVTLLSKLTDTSASIPPNYLKNTHSSLPSPTTSPVPADLPLSLKKQDLQTGSRISIASSPRQSQGPRKSENVKWKEKTSLSPQNSLIRESKSVKKIQIGIRGIKKYKDFQLKVESRTLETPSNPSAYLNKTPLTFAAERGNLECVQLLLETIVLKRNVTVATKEPLTLATKARSPESILLLMDKRISYTDFQSAVLTAIRELFPDCLSALLSTKSKERKALFQGVNLYHVLYSQSLVADYRYEMMVEMTRVLLHSREDVNAHNIPCTFPMYTLINCAFNINIGKMIFYYLECLELLLSAGANPHYDEVRFEKKTGTTESFSRQTYSSAIDCVVKCAKNSVNFFPNTYWPKLFLKKFISTIVSKDCTPRRVQGEALLCYMTCVCELGLDRYILKSLLRYGADPDFKFNSRYAVNVYFDLVMPYLTRFQVIRPKSWFIEELDTLMTIVWAMSVKCQREAVLIFLEDNLLQTPLQALPLVRYFSYLMNRAQMTPRPLTQIAAQMIWLCLRRNEKKARLLPLPDDLLSLIIP